ncbi:hypothetical protein O6H91_03G000100 [Diphasiastrum complanatum]|uniref:Uncharacterized protein n=1 Tax=Diphasiastrum complanatum TaxID=34168 RepID=A0ACC2E2P5_DIPCM|nr:hypothetical protein O6H91_03G000100 [Diphasiastrum complanatum]
MQDLIMEPSTSSGASTSSKQSGWSFGSFVKSLATKSEEVLQAYQKDLQEFGLGLKKETAAAAEVTARAVKVLPQSLETSAVVAQESLEAVGQSLEDFGSSVWRGTAEILTHVKDAVQNVEEDAVQQKNAGSVGYMASPLTNVRYNRYEAQVNAMQCDSSTYCNEPEDKEDYSLWLSTFDLNSRKSEMDVILNDNTFIQELKERIVPAIVDEKTFWTRYFYRLNKLQQTEDTRADIVKRATAGEEEELTWEVDDESDEVKPSVIPPFLETTKGSNSPSDALVEDIHNEDEAKSDNSTGSEWLVVQEDKDSLNLEVSQVKDAIASERSCVG